jgi:hypothetical protein
MALRARWHSGDECIGARELHVLPLRAVKILHRAQDMSPRMCWRHGQACAGTVLEEWPPNSKWLGQCTIGP